MEQPSEQAAEPTTGSATPGHPAGDRDEDRLAHHEPGDVGDGAVGPPLPTPELAEAIL